MALITVLAIGKVRESFIKEGEMLFRKRLSRYYSVEIGEVDKKASSIEEGKAFLSRVRASDFLVLLDERGVEYSSSSFAQFLSSRFAQARGSVVFGIGGADGWSEAVRARANTCLSLSRMTFPHQFARLILMEQLYRAASIHHGLPYHR